MPKVPSRLDRDPIVEATFQFRFQGKANAVADILQGAMYPALKGRFPKIQRNPIAEIPSELLVDPQLRYQARLLLHGTNQMVHLGDRSIGVTSVKPYPGWRNFQPLISELLDLANKADVVKECERISMRYTNLLLGDSPAAQFAHLNFQASLGREQYDLQNQLTHLRTEYKSDGVITIIEIGAETIMRTPEGETKGLAVAVDSVYDVPNDFLQNPSPHLTKLHDADKTVFFNLITEASLKKMGPHWD